jgi:hypothetical protein
LPCRKPPRPTSSASSRTPTCAQSTPNASPSCQRTSSLPAASEASAVKCFDGIYFSSQIKLTCIFLTH